MEPTHVLAEAIAHDIVNGNRGDARRAIAECTSPATLVLRVVRQLASFGHEPLDAVVNVQSLIDPMEPQP